MLIMMVNLPLFVVIVQIDCVITVIHSLEYFITTSSKIPNLPHYINVMYLDGVQIMYYDSDIRVVQARNEWVKEATADDPDFWEKETMFAISRQQVGRAFIEISRKVLNQSEGVHFGQARFGCEWNDETDEVATWEKMIYENGDLLILDMNTFTWIADSPHAVSFKQNWNHDKFQKEYRKLYYTKICPALLKKLVTYARPYLMRTELPVVSLLQKTPSSPVTCHATGFYPKTADLFWRKDGEQLHEDVDYGPTLPNHDGTFQMTAGLKAEVTAEVEGRYECVFRLAGVKDQIVTKLERRTILCNARIEEEEKNKMIVAIAVPLVIVTLMVLFVAIVIVKCQKRKPVGR
ncbi:major histocompatibility complex class I-related protein 1-like isoform X2 [Festucalex cinctus]